MARISQIDQVIQKYKKFWDREEVDEPILAVRNWILPPETINNCYDDEFVLKTYEENYRIRDSVNDDYVPMLCPEFGPALLGHIAGCEIQYKSGTSWNKRLLSDLSDHELEKVRFHEERFQVVIDRVKYFNAHNGNGYVISSGDLESPFELAVEVAGIEKFLLGFYDNPPQMHKLLNTCFDVWYEFVTEAQKLVTTHQGGYFSLWNTWQPENVIWTSVDAAINVSPRIFEEFFMPILDRMLARFDWIWLHLHSAGMAHILAFLLDEPRIKGFEIADDPNCKSKTIVPELKEIHQNKALLLDCKKDDLKLFADEFDPAGLLLFVDSVEAPEEANALLTEVRRQT